MMIDELKSENKALQEKLDIDVKALEEITTEELVKRLGEYLSILIAERALAKIKEIK